MAAVIAYFVEYLPTTTTYTASVGGTLTPSGALQKTDTKNLSAALGSSGNLVKTAVKNVSGILPPVGAVTGVKTAFLFVSGTLTASGSLAKRVTKSFSGLLSFVGTLNVFPIAPSLQAGFDGATAQLLETLYVAARLSLLYTPDQNTMYYSEQEIPDLQSKPSISIIYGEIE